MKIKTLFFPILMVIMISLGACARASAGDPQATIDAAVKATDMAQAAMQATIDAAVQATAQAQATQPSAAATAAAPQATSAPQTQPTPQPTPDYATLSEAELAALIDQAVNQALADYAAASTAVAQTTSDGTVSAEEAATTTTSVTNVTYEIAYAEELIEAYYDYYGAYADEALSTLEAIEADLSAISDDLNEMLAIVEQGADAATAAIDQLNAALTQAQAQAGELQTKIQGLQEQVKNGLGKRETELVNLPPESISDSPVGALNQAHDFLEAFKSALGDGKFSPDELTKIGQLAANARASLEKTGDPKLQGLGKSIEGLTRNAARGEWGQAHSGLGDFERSLPARRR